MNLRIAMKILHCGSGMKHSWHQVEKARTRASAGGDPSEWRRVRRGTGFILPMTKADFDKAKNNLNSLIDTV